MTNVAIYIEFHTMSSKYWLTKSYLHCHHYISVLGLDLYSGDAPRPENSDNDEDSFFG